MRVLIIYIVVLAAFSEVLGHGSLWKPASRNSAWRFGFNTPADYDDNQLYCGGMGVQWSTNGGKCGVCGDNFLDPIPRKHEDGGVYGQTGVRTATYKSGQEIDIQVHLSASHLGDFTFSICNLDNSQETEDCFKEVKFADGSSKYTDIPAPKDYNLKVKLPAGLTCNHCSFRWHYRTGNTYGPCDDGTSALGCGPQETFRNCADITITN